MKIAYYSHYFSPEIGAPSARIYDLSQQWLKQGHQVDVVTCYPNHPHGTLYPGYDRGRYLHEVLDGINVHRNWTYVTPNKGFIKRSLGHVSLWPSARLHASRRLGAVDAVIGTSPTLFAAMAALGEARRRRVPFIMEVRDLWPALFVELGVLTNPTIIGALERWELWMYRQAARIVTVTEAFKDDIARRGISAEKIDVIPNGAAIDFWQPRPIASSAEKRAQLKLTDKFVALYIGAHGISQALSSVLESAAQLQAQNPNVHFLFVGDGAEKEMLMAKAQADGLNNVTFHPPVPKSQVADFYALADVCLVPLRNIPLFKTFIPSKMFEMLAMERPIIGCLTGESAGILQCSGAATIVEPENATHLTAAVLEMATHSAETRADLGRRGRQFVSEQFSRQQLAARYIETLQRAVGNAAPRLRRG